MSIDTWKAEFYPVAASQVKDRLVAVEHSLQKWIGVRKVNLLKHGLTHEQGSLGLCEVYFSYRWNEQRLTQPLLHMSPQTCALCVLYQKAGQTVEARCGTCPIYDVRHRGCADESIIGDSPYWRWCTEDDPEPMIRLLERTLENERKKQDESRNMEGGVLPNTGLAEQPGNGPEGEHRALPQEMDGPAPGEPGTP